MIQIFDKAMTMTLKSAFRDWVVIVDDGHGYETAGKRSNDGSLRENEFNSSVEDKLTLFLNACDIEYYSLASGWADENLSKRSKLENEIYNDAKLKGKKTVGVSIHADAFTDVSAHGFAVYYFEKNGVISKEGKILARHIADAIISSDFQNAHVIKARHNNGISGANFHMLRETAGIWSLVENAFMSNAIDLALLKRDDFRNNRALAILEGLYKYITLR